MTPDDAITEMARIFPEARKELYQAAGTSAFTLVQVCSDKFKGLLLENKAVLVDKALRLMDKMHSQGDTILRLAVENVFIFSLYSIASCSKNIDFWGKVPMGIYTAYIRQIYQSGI